MNQVEQSWKQLEDAFIQEILSAKKRFIVGCLYKILPPELFQLAKESKEQKRVQDYCTKEGYRWMETSKETLLMKENCIIGRFRPVLVGKGPDKHCEFLAFVLGEQIPVADDRVKVSSN